MFPNSVKKLEKYLKRLGLAPRKKWGQNFLLPQHYHHLLIQSAEVTPEDLVVEIGAGLGHLTQFLQVKAGFVLAVEVDPQLASVLQEVFASAENSKILPLDVLASKHQIHPALLAEIHTRDFPHYKVVANLPYNISAPVISNFLKLDTPPKVITCTIQKEVAERLVAPANSSQYGPLSVIAQLLADVTIIQHIPASAFYPPPKVTSSIVKLVPRQETREKVKDLEIFSAFVQAIFGLRRKTIANALRKTPHLELSQEAISYILRDVAKDRRGESFSLEEIIELANQTSDFLKSTKEQQC